MVQSVTHRCHIPIRGRDGFWRTCGRAAHFVTIPLDDGYVGWEPRDVGTYCAQHARASAAEHNTTRRSVLRWEHAELLHRQIVAGCPACSPI